MAEQMGGEPKKTGFFARRKEKKLAKKAAKFAKAHPKATSRLPAAPVKAPPPPPPPHVRVSLESIPEVEKRIDRMAAVQRRQALIERYEKKYGERLDLPKVFISVAEEKREGAAAGADALKAGAKPIPEARLAAVTGIGAAPRPATAPAKTAGPLASPAAAPARPASPRSFFSKLGKPAKAEPATAKPAPAPSAPSRPPIAEAPGAPAAEAPKLPEGQTMFKYLWPQLWPFWGFPLRKYAKFRWPEKRSTQLAFTIVDIPLLILLAIPRLLFLFWVGLALWVVKFIKKRRAAKLKSNEPEEGAVPAD